MNSYSPGDSVEISFSFLNFTFKCLTNEVVTTNRTFNFLNLKKKFDLNIDWNYQEYGKLWNYNLQYFHCLQQENLQDQTKILWLVEINDWLKSGKLKLEPYPVSLRVMNVIRYLSEKKNKDTTIIKGTYCQLNYLNSNLEYHLLGNHLLENAFALMMGSCFFKVKSWEQKATKILYHELNEQILNDGGHFELSPMYHQIILFRLLELIDWYSNYKNADAAFLQFINKKTMKMLSWLKVITFKNGDIPHFNDSTNGIVYRSKVLFKIADELNLNENLQLKLNESGYRKFAADKYECIVDVGNAGAIYQPGHAHADALSFILYINNLPVFIEAGTSTYQISTTRNAERSTLSHNTVVINETNQSEVWGGFRLGHRAEVTVIEEAEFAITATHNGYKKKFNAIHQRSFNFDANELIIKDAIITSKNMDALAYFHFHPDCKLQIQNNGILINEMAAINFSPECTYQLVDFNYAEGFNIYRKSVCLVVQFKRELLTSIKFL